MTESKEHCHGCGKLWSEESPDCVFNYHKKPEIDLSWQNCSNIQCQDCHKTIAWIEYDGHIEEWKQIYCTECFEK